jgi:hypothetical protein
VELPEEVIEVTLPGADGAQIDDLGVVICGHIGHRKSIFVHLAPNIACARLAHG